MIFDLGSDDTFGRPFVGEHHGTKKFHQYRRSGPLTHELDLPDKQVHSGGPVVRPQVSRVVRIVRDTIALDIANWPGNRLNYERTGRLLAEDWWRVFRNNCIEGGQRIPPFADMRRVQPSVH